MSCSRCGKPTFGPVCDVCKGERPPDEHPSPPPIVELTDHFHQDEPLAYLVLCPSSCAICEYKVFANEQPARDEARNNAGDDEDGKGRGWVVYPLYAGQPIVVD